MRKLSEGKELLRQELSERVRCSYILNCAMECTNAFPERFQYMKLELQDNFGEDITKEFESSFAFIGTKSFTQSKPKTTGRWC